MVLLRDLLAKAGFEVVAADPVDNLFTGRIVFNDPSKVLRIYYDGVWNTIGASASATGNVNFEAVLDSNLDLSPITADAFDYGYFLYPTTTPNDVARTVTLPATGSGEYDKLGIKVFSGYFSDITISAADSANIQDETGAVSTSYTVRGREFVVMFWDPDVNAWVVTDSPLLDIGQLGKALAVSASIDLEATYITNRVANEQDRYRIPSVIVNSAAGVTITLFDATSTDIFLRSKPIRVINPTAFPLTIAGYAGQTIANDIFGTTPTSIVIQPYSYCLLYLEAGATWHFSESSNPRLSAADDTTTTGSDQDVSPTAGITRFSEGNLASIRGFSPDPIRILYVTNNQAAQLILNNEDGAAAAETRIITGTGSNFGIEPGATVPLVYDQVQQRWLLTGGSASGGGGAPIIPVTFADSPVTVETPAIYLADTTGGQIIFNMPEISTIPAFEQPFARAKFVDCAGNWHVNSILINAGGADTINFGDATSDTSLLGDVQGQNITMDFEAATEWCLETNFQPIDSSGGGSGGTGQGAKNYVLNPDGTDGTDDITADASITVSQTTITSELPENNTKPTAIKLVQSGGAGGEKATWGVNAIDFGDDGRIGAVESYLRTLPGYADGDATLRWIDQTTGLVYGETVINTDTKRPNYPVSMPLIATNALTPQVEFNVTDSAGLSLSSVSTLAESPLAGSLGGWKEYTEADGITVISNTTTVNQFFTNLIPYKDPITGEWFLTGTVSVRLAGSTNNPRVVINGISARATRDGATNTFYPVACMNGSGANIGGWIYSSSNGGNPNEFAVDGTAAASTTWVWNFNIPLDDKPTWADFDGTVAQGSDVLEENTSSFLRWTINQVVLNSTWEFMKPDDVINISGFSYDSGTGIFTALNDFEGRISVGAEFSQAGFTSVSMRIRNGADTMNYSPVNTGQSNLAYDIKISTGDTFGCQINLAGAANGTIIANDAANISIEAKAKKSTTLTGLPTNLIANETQQFLVLDDREFAIDLTGSGGFTGGTLYGTRFANRIFLSSTSLTHASSASVTSAAGVIPAGFLPMTTGRNCYLYDRDHGLNIAANANGSITVFYENETSGVNRTSSLETFVSYRTSDA